MKKLLTAAASIALPLTLVKLPVPPAADNPQISAHEECNADAGEKKATSARHS